MNVHYKIMYLSFLALTLFSIFYTSYTVYTFYGAKFAVNWLEVQIIKVVADEQLRQIIMQLELQNRYWVDLKVKYFSYKLFYNYKEVNSGEKYFSDPIDVPAYSTRHMNLTFTLNMESKTFGGIWKLHIQRMVLITPIDEAIKEIEISSKGG